MIALLFLLLGGSVGAVTFDEAMQKRDAEGVWGEEGLFPTWLKGKIQPAVNPLRVDGVIGGNQDYIDGIPIGESGQVRVSGSEKLLMNYIPHLINILLKFVAPLIMVAMIYAGIRFVYAGSNEEELSQAKDIFTYTLMGALFVILSYSIMKALYFLLST